MKTGLIAILCFFIALDAKAAPIALAASAQSPAANSSIILARKKKIGRSRFCRAVFSCRAAGGWGACMRRTGSIFARQDYGRIQTRFLTCPNSPFVSCRHPNRLLRDS